jgi:D-alanyl-D-alanine dipeptidase
MKLVNLSDYGIKSMHYYWVRRENFNISKDELREIGITGNVAQVDESLVPKLREANEAFKKHGYEIIVKDGYRSPQLYELVKTKRYANDGQETTDKTLNPKTKPHATGLVVDINLISLKTDKEVETWDSKSDWPDGVFIDFYKHSDDPRHQEYQRLQVLMREVMFGLGFKLGSLKEYWHFELRQ